MRILDLIDLNRGETLKQGDSTLLKFQIADRDKIMPDRSGKQARVVFMFNNSIIHEELTVVQTGNIVEFHISEILPPNTYTLEIHVGGQIFPSDDFYFKISRSAANADYNIINLYGVDNIVNRAVDDVSAKFVDLTKEKLGLGNVVNVKQASEEEIVEARGGKPVLNERLQEIEGGVQIVEDKYHSFKNISNTDRAITDLINIALTYSGEPVMYGNVNTLFHDVTTDEIDCSTFVQAALANIPFVNSKYNGGNNSPATNTGYIFPKQRMLAHEIGKLCYDNGWMFEVEPDLSNLRIGDLIFYCQSPWPDFWRSISHVAIIYNNHYNSGYQIIEARNSEVEYAVQRDVFGVNKYGEYNALYAARFPMTSTQEPIENIAFAPKQVNVSVGGRFRALELVRPLQERKLYTLYADFQGAIGSDNYPIIKSKSGKTIVSLYNSSPLKRRFTLTFWLDKGALSGVNQDELEIYLVGANHGEVKLTEFYIFDGLVTNFEHINQHDKIESITKSNENGSYTKYSDGTLVCTYTHDLTAIPVNQATGSIFKSNFQRWTFPLAFKEPPQVFSSSANGIFWSTLDEFQTQYSTTHKLMSPISSPTGTKVNLMARGKWM